MKYGRAVLLPVFSLLIFSGSLFAYSPGMRAGMIGGPWELVVRTGAGSEPVRFPVDVENESKEGDLDRLLPLLGSATKVRIVKYLPDLQWDTYGVTDEAGGVVLKLNFKGPNLDTDIWIDSGDPMKRAVTSTIGGLMAIGIHEAKNVEKLAKSLADPKAIGIVSIWLEGEKKPVQLVAIKGKTETVGKSGYQLSVLDYVPHYSVDPETKEVTNASDKPVNPALKVRLSADGKDYEQWLWSKFPSSPHSEGSLPVRAEFANTEQGKQDGNYLLLGSKGVDPWLISVKNKKKKAARLDLKERYPLGDESYSMSVEDYLESGKLLHEWKNGSSNLKNPAIIVSVEKGDKKIQHALELNKSVNHEDGTESMVLVFAKKGALPGGSHGMGGMMKK